MTAEEKVTLIAKWADWFYDHAENFEDTNIGAQVAYLYAAIAKGTSCAFYETDEIVLLLREEEIPAEDPIWQFITIENEE